MSQLTEEAKGALIKAKEAALESQQKLSRRAWMICGGGLVTLLLGVYSWMAWVPLWFILVYAVVFLVVVLSFMVAFAISVWKLVAINDQLDPYPN